MCRLIGEVHFSRAVLFCEPQQQLLTHYLVFPFGKIGRGRYDAAVVPFGVVFVLSLFHCGGEVDTDCFCCPSELCVALLSCCVTLSVFDFTGRAWTAEPSRSK